MKTIPLPPGDYGYYHETLNCLSDFYFPNSFLSPVLFGYDSPGFREAEKAHKDLICKQANYSRRCKSLGIPVPRMHGPVNRKRIGEALRLMVIQVEEKENECLYSCSDY